MATVKANQKKRIDELLVARGLAQSLEEARALVMAGKVIAKEQRVSKASEKLLPDVALRVKTASKYVSRSGEKLEHVLRDLRLSLEGAVVLDIGASTGGFTQCCLLHKARHVYALDVGTNQLAWEIRQNDRVTAFEKTDIRHLDRAMLTDGEPNLVVADVSFNALSRLAPYIQVAAPEVTIGYLLLVKPQFELPREQVPDGGVVIDQAARGKAVAMVEAAFRELGFSHFTAVEARVKGRTGNQEVFLFVEAKDRAR